MAKRTLSRSIQSLGGKSLAKKWAPAYCPKCGKELPWTMSWYGYLGHLGLHGLADRYFGGDIKACQRRLSENGRARQEQDASWQNGAFKPYRPIKEHNQ